MDRSKRFTLFASPGRPVHSDTNSASPGSILARQQLRAKAKSLTFPALSIARYSFIQLSEQGRQCTVQGTYHHQLGVLWPSSAVTRTANHVPGGLDLYQEQQVHIVGNECHCDTHLAMSFPVAGCCGLCSWTRHVVCF